MRKCRSLGRRARRKSPAGPPGIRTACIGCGPHCFVPVRCLSPRKWMRYFSSLVFSLLRSRSLSFTEKVDALFVLACYLTAPVLILGWLASLVLFFSPQMHSVPILSIALMFVGYQIFGNQATFFELGIAALLDGMNRRVLLMPCNLFNFFARD